MPPILVPVTAVIAVASAIIAQVPNIPDALQYGALGLCGLMVVLNWITSRSMALRLDEGRNRVLDLHERTISTLTRLCDGLEDRPCLMSDHRIRDTKRKLETGGG